MKTIFKDNLVTIAYNYTVIAQFITTTKIENQFSNGLYSQILKCSPFQGDNINFYYVAIRN